MNINFTTYLRESIRNGYLPDINYPRKLFKFRADYEQTYKNIPKPPEEFQVA